jgi:DNA polymerase-3 subunit beta
VNVIINKRELIRSLSLVAMVTESKATHLVYGQAFLDVQAHGPVFIHGTNGVRVMSVELSGVEIQKPGACLIPAKDLLERAKAMPDGGIQIAFDQRAATIKASGSARKYKVHAQGVEDFPVDVLTPMGTKTGATLRAADLASLIHMTSFAVSPDETRPHLNGALLEWEGKSVRMVSTDGHRLSAYTLAVENDGAVSGIIPLRSLADIAKVLDGAGSGTEVTINTWRRSDGGGPVGVEVGGVAYITQTPDAKFPPWRQVVPSEDPKDFIARVDRLLLIDAIRAASVAAAKEARNVTLGFGPKGVAVRSESPDGGDAEDEVAAEYVGKPFRIGANAGYMLQVLSVLPTTDVLLRLKGELDPILVKPGPTEEPIDYVGVVMPCRI